MEQEVCMKARLEALVAGIMDRALVYRTWQYHARQLDAHRKHRRYRADMSVLSLGMKREWRMVCVSRRSIAICLAVTLWAQGCGTRRA